MAATMTVREQLEARERDTLDPRAAFSGASRGRQVEEEEDPYRTRFQRDRDRILHTKAFRRLKRKTQVFLAPAGDHYRTRLTHTLEVAQIARTVARALFLNEDLTEAIALGHDLGHTPFGHAGERALDQEFSQGFRHAEQSLRVVDKLETRGEKRGLNLTHEVRDGLLYHSAGKVILQGRTTTVPATLEGRVVCVCDAIAYINHDIDDARRARIVSLSDLPRGAIAQLGDTSSKRIDRMVVGLIEGSRDGEIAFAPAVLEPMNVLRDYLYHELYPSPPLHTEIAKAETLLRALYRHLLAHPVKDIANTNTEDSLERRTVDFVAGMTDAYAFELYHRLLLPAPWKY